jgi:hypothetical protein
VVKQVGEGCYSMIQHTFLSTKYCARLWGSLTMRQCNQWNDGGLHRSRNQLHRIGEGASGMVLKEGVPQAKVKYTCMHFGLLKLDRSDISRFLLRIFW